MGKKLADVYVTRKAGEIHTKASYGWVWVVLGLVVLVGACSSMGH